MWSIRDEQPLCWALITCWLRILAVADETMVDSRKAARKIAKAFIFTKDLNSGVHVGRALI